MHIGDLETQQHFHILNCCHINTHFEKLSVVFQQDYIGLTRFLLMLESEGKISILLEYSDKKLGVSGHSLFPTVSLQLITEGFTNLSAKIKLILVRYQISTHNEDFYLLGSFPSPVCSKCSVWIKRYQERLIVGIMKPSLLKFECWSMTARWFDAY